MMLIETGGAEQVVGLLFIIMFVFHLIFGRNEHVKQKKKVLFLFSLFPLVGWMKAKSGHFNVGTQGES